MAKLPDRTTTPIENYFYHTNLINVIRNIFSEVRYDREKLNQSLISYHKTKLGRQTSVFTGAHRLWVWDRPKYRLFVGNKKGICIEVDFGVDSLQAIEAIKEYISDIGISLSDSDHKAIG